MPTTYDWRTDSSVLSTDNYEAFLDPVTGDFSVSVVVEVAPQQGAIGVVVSGGADTTLFAVGDTTDLAGDIFTPMDEEGLEVPAPVTLVVQCVAGVLSFWYSADEEITWVEQATTTPDAPTQAGAFVYALTLAGTQTGTVGEPRLVPDELLVAGVIPPPVEQFVTIGSVPTDPPPPLTVSQEAVVHGIVGAMFADLELDVGKSVRWTQQFCDDIFIVDQAGGGSSGEHIYDQRYWVINWSASFPQANYDFASANYFVVPETYRKEQWAKAQKYMVFDDNDWVVFVDSHEGLSADTRSRPDDVLISPYKSYIYREIARANEGEGSDRIVVPFFVFVKEVGPQNVQYDHPYWAQFGTKAEQAASVPYYLPYQGMTRIIKASTLKDPDFDWSIIDTPTDIVDPAIKIQIISYGYAHWNLKDIVPPATEVEPLSAANDLGWQQRCLMSRVRPITGLPAGDYKDPVGTWQDPSTDVAGTRGPWCLDLKPTTGAECPSPPGEIPTTTAGLLVPLYDLIFRLNLRDGLWYEAGGLGNVPLVWNADDNRWEPSVDAQQWHQSPNWVAQP